MRSVLVKSAILSDEELGAVRQFFVTNNNIVRNSFDLISQNLGADSALEELSRREKMLIYKDSEKIRNYIRGALFIYLSYNNYKLLYEIFHGMPERFYERPLLIEGAISMYMLEQSINSLLKLFFQDSNFIDMTCLALLPLINTSYFYLGQQENLDKYKLFNLGLFCLPIIFVSLVSVFSYLRREEFNRVSEDIEKMADEVSCSKDLFISHNAKRETLLKLLKAFLSERNILPNVRIELIHLDANYFELASDFEEDIGKQEIIGNYFLYILLAKFKDEEPIKHIYTKLDSLFSSIKINRNYERGEAILKNTLVNFYRGKVKETINTRVELLQLSIHNDSFVREMLGTGNPYIGLFNERFSRSIPLNIDIDANIRINSRFEAILGLCADKWKKANFTKDNGYVLPNSEIPWNEVFQNLDYRSLLNVKNVSSQTEFTKQDCISFWSDKISEKDAQITVSK